MSDIDEPSASLHINMEGHAQGQGKIYQVGRGDQYIDNSTHYHDPSGKRTGPHPLAVEQPPAWEYLLYASILGEGMSALEGKWLGFCHGHTVRATRYTDERTAVQYLNHALTESGRIVESMAGWLSIAAQDQAFGRPGEPGNPLAIEHNARGLCDLFGEWLDLAIELRSVAIPGRISRARELTLALMDNPIIDGHRFLRGVIEQFEAIPRLATERSPGQPIVIELTFKPTVDDRVFKERGKELKRLRRPR